MREDGRQDNKLRSVRIKRGFLGYSEGSCLLELGKTQVLCSATIENKVPNFLKGTGEGWVTAEYFMHPRATPERNSMHLLGKNKRSIEISRMIARSLRGSVQREVINEWTITVDCEVLQADGGTRTACVTGGFIALYDATRFMLQKNLISENPIIGFLAGISVGIYKNRILLDLTYQEDFESNFDLNVVMREDRNVIEIQGTAEKGGIKKREIEKMLELAWEGISNLIKFQKEALC